MANPKIEIIKTNQNNWSGGDKIRFKIMRVLN